MFGSKNSRRKYPGGRSTLRINVRTLGGNEQWLAYFNFNYHLLEANNA
jgi:hypothetical protein